MKIQHIAIIFIIIILPIALTMNMYINSQIDTITLQMNYNDTLTQSTYAAVKAFQINTVNNRYSSISDSKIRDIEASVNTFYNTLSSSENLSVDALRTYVPALVFTLYDGYYIYTKYDNVYSIDPSKVEEASEKRGETIALQPILDEEALKSEKYENYGLKPYIYYSCRYKNGTKDFVVNYTLDNAITLYGVFDTTGYQTLSGYLINPNAVTIKSYNTNSPQTWWLDYNGVAITPEILTEHLLFIDKSEGDYDYLTYNGQKIYYDKNKVVTGNETKYFMYQNYNKVYLSSSHTNKEMTQYLNNRVWGDRLHSTSSFEYYLNAQKFSQTVATLTNGITQNDAVDEEGRKIDFSESEGYVNTGNEPIFVASDKKNDPLLSGSTFNENRMMVIRKSIETNLSAAIAKYQMYSGNNYEFALPQLTETDWSKITNQISVTSFLQGIPIGHKYYNNYCVITNDDNEETVNKENIYLITQNANGEREYHLPGCTKLAEPQSNSNLVLGNSNNQIAAAYSNVSFIRQTVRIAEGDYMYFYPQIRGNENSKTHITACYHCIVNAGNVYQADEIIKGVIMGKDNNWNDRELFNVTKAGAKNERIKTIREYYIRALARERYDLYRANVDAFNHH